MRLESISELGTSLSLLVMEGDNDDGPPGDALFKIEESKTSAESQANSSRTP
jgi:hypothetical protein